jgi:hypothetical protein
VYDPAGVLIHHESVSARHHKSIELVDSDWNVFVRRWQSFIEKIRVLSRQRLLESAADSSIVVFGTGRLGLMVASELSRIGIPPAAFSDSNPSTWGSRIGSLKVLAPGDIDNLPNAFILPAAMREAEVLESLHEHAVQTPVISPSLSHRVVRQALQME